MTLIELLVVLAVISVLAGISLPTVKNALKNQRVNRGATILQSAIQEGRARAIASGGGGVIIERLGATNIAERSTSVRVRLADAPPPYTGDSPNATAKYQYLYDGETAGPISNPNGPRGSTGTARPNNPFRDYHVLLFNGSLQPQLLRSARDIANGDEPTLINRGDIIRIGDAKYPMIINQIVELTLSTAPPWAFWQKEANDPKPVDYPNPQTSTPVGTYVMMEVMPQEDNVDLRRHAGKELSFEVRKSPRPAIALPIELSRGTAIDLTASGIGRYGNQFSPMWIDSNYLNPAAPPFNVTSFSGNYQSIYILFGSRGEVRRILSASLIAGVPQLVDVPVTGDVHLLVGHAGQTKTEPDDQLEDNDPDPIGDEAKDGTTPLLDPESIWVTIKARSGEVITSPWVDPTDQNDPSTQLIPPRPASPTNASRETRIRTLIGRTRSAAVDSRGEEL